MGERRGGLWPRVGIVAGAVGLVVAFYALGYDQYLTWEAIQTNLHHWREDARRNLPLGVLLFFLAYVGTTALSLPVSFFLSILGGALFDFWVGTAVCSMASTAGAVLAFLNSRYVLRAGRGGDSAPGWGGSIAACSGTGRGSCSRCGSRP